MTDRLSWRAAAILGITTATIAACGRGSTSGAGGSPSAVMTAAAKPAAIRVPSGVTPTAIAMGDSIFHANACARCHGPTAHGAQNGPTLVKGDSAKWLHSDGSYEGIIRTITAGVPKDSLVDKTRRFQMNPRGSNPPISDDAVKAVAAYLWKLNHP